MATKEMKVIDALGEDDEIQPAEYRITSYGADYPVELLVKRQTEGELYTPPFQRGFVWDQKMASRFIESLLLGLPVPGIFLSKEPKTETHLIIDGQQRLKTLQYFYKGIFEPKGKRFSLQGVQTRFQGQVYETLPPADRRRLDNAIIHTTIIRQDAPEEEQTAIFHIFERLNTGGRLLAPQEIRTALFHGPLVELLEDLNKSVSWRTIYGDMSAQKRDQELILRFLAFKYYFGSYAAPMKTFLNRYMGRNRNLDHQSSDQLRRAFTSTIDLALLALGDRAFKPTRALNAAVFDSVMYALSRRLDAGPVTNSEILRERYEHLIGAEDFLAGSQRATANEQRVAERFNAAVAAFEDIP